MGPLYHNPRGKMKVRNKNLHSEKKSLPISKSKQKTKQDRLNGNTCYG